MSGRAAERVGAALLWLALVALASCGGARGPAPCPTGEVEGPLGACTIDLATPPCRCATSVRCCSGEVCVAPVSAPGVPAHCDTCPLRCHLGVLFCAEGLIAVDEASCLPAGP